MDDINPTQSGLTTLEILREFSGLIEDQWNRRSDLSELVDSEMWRVEEDLSVAGDEARSIYLKMPELIRQHVGSLSLFEIADLAQSAMRLVESDLDKKVPYDVRYVTIGLTIRAISTVREIALLLEHGHAFGAMSRWRTLSEILVVAEVLVAGNRYTATRYIEHRWVMLARERRKTQNLDWDSDLPIPEIKVKQLTRRFGKTFDSEFGWASTVTLKKLGVAKPQWGHLVQIAEIAQFSTRVQHAHHAVHADALGFLGTVVDDLMAFHAGASSQQVLEVARDTARLFQAVMWALFNTYAKQSSSSAVRIQRAIVDDHLLSCAIHLSHRLILTDERVRERHNKFWDQLLSNVNRESVT